MSKGIRRFLLTSTIYSSSLLGSPQVDDVPPAPRVVALEQFLFSYGVDYNKYASPRPPLARSSGLRGIVFEDLVNPQNSLGVRHGYAVAAMADQRADEIAQADIPINLVDESQMGVTFLNTPDNALLSPIVDNVDVIGLSYVLDQPMSTREVRKKDVAHLQQAGGKTIPEYDAFWDDNRPIVVQSAGNSNKGLFTGVENEQETALMRHGRYLQIGSALKHRDGAYYVPGYSARIGPSFVVTEGFRKEFKFEYFEDEDSVRVRLEKVLEKDGYDALVVSRTGKECANDPHIHDTRAALEQKSDDSELKKAYRAAVVDCYVRYHNRISSTAPENNIAPMRVLGTSFAQPEAMGMVMGALHRYENRLSRDDIMALSMIAAEPVFGFEAEGGQVQDKLQYWDNGTGILAYNFNLAGFGILHADHLEYHAQRMATLRHKNPSLQTEPSRVNSPWVQNQIPERASGVRNEVPQSFVIDMADDILVINTMLQIRLQTKQGQDAPDIPSVRLTSPQNITFEIPVTSAGGVNTMSFANTPAFMGNKTRGAWTVTLPAGVEASEVRLSVYGVKRRGLIESYLEILHQERARFLSTPTAMNFDRPALL